MHSTVHIEFDLGMVGRVFRHATHCHCANGLQTHCVLHMELILRPSWPIHLNVHMEFDPGMVGKGVLVCLMTSLHKWSSDPLRLTPWSLFSVPPDQCTRLFRQGLIQEWSGRVFRHATRCHCANGLQTHCVLHMGAYFASLLTNPPECSHGVWSQEWSGRVFWYASWRHYTNGLQTHCVLHLGAYLATLPTNAPECLRRVRSRNGREERSDGPHVIIAQYGQLQLTLLGVWRPEVEVATSTCPAVAVGDCTSAESSTEETKLVWLHRTLMRETRYFEMKKRSNLEEKMRGNSEKLDAEERPNR